MHALSIRLTKIFFVTIIALSTASIASAKEINTESFSGTINTTLSSGFTIRASERDCRVSFGYQHTSVVIHRCQLQWGYNYTVVFLM